MYTLSKGPTSKNLVASSRRRWTPHRQVDFGSYDKSIKSFRNGDGEDHYDEPAEMSIQKPTFKQRNNNYRRSQPSSNQDLTFQENHIEMAELLSRQWKKVEESLNNAKEGESPYEYYREKKPHKNLEHFQSVYDKSRDSRPLSMPLGNPS